MKEKLVHPPLTVWGLFFLTFMLFHWQCQPGKKVNGTPCRHQGTVQDYSGLDGCHLLIVTEKGEKLLPAVIDDTNFELKGGQKIRFSYVEMPDQMSICMTEDKIVRITCIQLSDKLNRPAIPPCVKWDNIEKESWLADLQSQFVAQKIIRYPYKTDGWAYLFTGKEFYLYDCQGTLIRKATSEEACLRGEVTETNAGVVIFPTHK